jgi:uncharacterized damage-inducible protein DinB
MATTRRVLERVPSEQGQWKPHEKSFSIGHLAQLVSMMPSWIAQTLRSTEIDIGGGGGYSYEATEKLLQVFDQGVRQAADALSSVSGSDLEVGWSLKAGPHVLYTKPRGPAAREHLNHLIHHRGQLTVYLRLLNVPVPSIYGPTADEQWSRPGAST